MIYWKTYRDMRVTLVERFPKCFVPSGSKKRPLAIGIEKAILARAPDLDAKAVKMMLEAYTGAPKYWLACINGELRVDLDGNAAGVVKPSDAAFAAACLKKHAEAKEAAHAWRQVQGEEAA